MIDKLIGEGTVIAGDVAQGVAVIDPAKLRLRRPNKARLLKLMADYESGAIDPVTYSRVEGEIMANLSELTQQITKSDNPEPSSNLGLGL